MKLIELLTQADCSPRNYGSYLTCKAKYRGGNDPGSIGIYLSKNIAKDFVTGKTFSLEEFLKLTLGIANGDQLSKILEDKAGYFDLNNKDENPFSEIIKTFSEKEIFELKNDPSYWISRSIPKDTLNIFGGGVCLEGKMANRYVFPIFNAYKKIIGFSGRDVTGKSRIKWKHIGQKNQWSYPFFFNHSIIKEKKQLILVESIGDMLSLWRSGIKQVGVTFGTDIGKGMMKSVLRLDPSEIIISMNKDNNFAGQRASNKIFSKLSEFFDPQQIKVCFPIKNDFGDQNDQENKDWYFQAAKQWSA
jgi:hypothetical protein